MIFSLRKDEGKWPFPHAWSCMETSSVMNSVLRKMVCGKKTVSSKSTIQALQDRGLLDELGNLTETGRVYALSKCSLRIQCELLGLPLSQITLLREGQRPEFDVLADYCKRGWQGCFTEGGIIFVLLYCIWYDLFCTHVMQEKDCDRETAEASFQHNVFWKLSW